MKPKKKFAKVKSKRSKMPKFYPIDDQMKELSAMLEKEISDWPGVSRRPMFGYQGLYRDGQIFAALPRSRAMKSPTSIMIKFASASPAVLESVKKDSRVATVSGMSGGGWFFFELDDASATKGALGWLGRAYEAAKK
jgi:TfoX/Sxy family transcriptional regulator of competence genes